MRSARSRQSDKHFGVRVRELRKAKGLSLRNLAPKLGVGFTYRSKVETGSLDFGNYPSEALIRKLADVLDADVDELLILAEKVPEQIRRRDVERPEVFRALASCDDAVLDRVMAEIGKTTTTSSEQATLHQIR